MKKPFCIFLILLLIGGCTPKEEPSPLAEPENVDTRLNFLWDRSNEHFNTNPDSALFYMQEVKSLAEANDRQKWVAAAYGALGDIQREQGQLSEAVYQYLYAAKVSQEIGELSRMATSYNNIGYIYMQVKNYETAIAYLDKAKAIYVYKGSGDDKAMVAQNLGICYREVGRREEAEAVLFAGLQDARSGILKSRIHNTLGVLFYQKGMQEKAREQYQMSMDFTGLGTDSLKVMAGAFSNIGESYLEEGDFEKAEKWLYKALQVKEKTQAVFIQSTINALGQLKIEQGRYEEAVQVLEEGLQNMDPAVVDFVMGESLSLINEALVKSGRTTESPEKMRQLNSQLSDYSQRLVRYNQQLMKFKERLELADRQQGLDLSADKFELDKKLGKAQEEQEQVKLVAILVPALMLLIGALIVYWFIRRQRRTKAVMGAIEEVLNRSALRQRKN